MATIKWFFWTLVYLRRNIRILRGQDPFDALVTFLHKLSSSWYSNSYLIDRMLTSSRQVEMADSISEIIYQTYNERAKLRVALVICAVYSMRLIITLTLMTLLLTVALLTCVGM